MLRGTPFHTRTSALCQAQNWRRWAGYLVAGSYELTHDREYYAIRSAAALFDVSPLYKYRISGPDAARLLDRVVTRDLARCQVHQVMYTPWCDEAGKVIDDGTVQRLDEQDFRLTAAEPNLLWLDENGLGLEVDIQDETDRVAALSLQGPASRSILNAVSDGDFNGLRYFHLTPARIGEVPVTVSRTGYTGDLGYEIWVDAERAESLWDTLTEAGQPYGITPAGMLALDLARVEAGLILIDVDYISTRQALIEDQKSSPFELGLGWAVALDNGNFVGRQALLAEKRRDPAWRFVGLEVGWQTLERLYAEVGLAPHMPSVAWRTSVPVYAGDKQVGYATSGCWSPILKRYIALAHVEAGYARRGSEIALEITIEHHPNKAPAQVVKTPFFSPERKRK